MGSDCEDRESNILKDTELQVTYVCENDLGPLRLIGLFP